MIDICAWNPINFRSFVFICPGPVKSSKESRMGKPRGESGKND